MGGRVGQNLEGKGQQRVAGQHRRRLVELPVRGRLAAPQVVVVHAGQVVVHQGIGVQGLDRGADPQSPILRNVEQSRAGQDQEGPEPLSAGENRIAHRLLHPGVMAGGLGQEGVKGQVGQARRLRQGRLQPPLRIGMLGQGRASERARSR